MLMHGVEDPGRDNQRELSKSEPPYSGGGWCLEETLRKKG